MKRKIKVLLCSTILLVAIMLCETTSNNNITVDSFSLDEYSTYVQQFKSNRYVFSAKTAKEACDAAENIWNEVFDITWYNYKPYMVSFDKENHVWLIRGQRRGVSLGGVPYILLHENGKVIAVWHDK